MRFGRGRGQQRRGGNPIQILLRRLLVDCLLGFATAAVAAEPPTYRIGPGDVLEITVWREPELSTAVTVRPDGRISFPLVEDLPASGRTPMALAEAIPAALAEYLQDTLFLMPWAPGLGAHSTQHRKRLWRGNR